MSVAPSRPRLDLLFVIDPVEKLTAGHDTSVAMMESAQARGHRILVTTMQELAVHHGRAVARCTPLAVHPAELRDGHWHARTDWYSAGPVERWGLDEMDAIFVRTDPPVDGAYMRGTFVLDFVDPQRTVLVNGSAGLRNANEKFFPLQWPDLCPETVFTSSVDEVLELARTWGTAVIKPTDGMAGRGVMLLRDGDPNLRSITEAVTHRGRDQVVVQRFIERSDEGDRRVIVLDGEPIGAVRRVAAGAEFRCNMAAGASVLADSVTPRDKEICERIAPALREQNLHFVGIDVIGELLTEINVTSPTGIREIDAFAGTRLSDTVLCWVESRVRRLADT